MSLCDLAKHEEFKWTSQMICLSALLCSSDMNLLQRSEVAALRGFKLLLVQFKLCKFVTQLCTLWLGNASSPHWLMGSKCRLTSGWISAPLLHRPQMSHRTSRGHTVQMSAALPPIMSSITHTLCWDTWAQTGLCTFQHEEVSGQTSWMIERKIL